MWRGERVNQTQHKAGLRELQCEMGRDYLNQRPITSFKEYVQVREMVLPQDALIRLAVHRLA
jgi:hypothetical protein